MLNQSQFNLQSNLKNKPNAQGTLFSANPSQRTPESRQPRGYSPKRERDVGRALSLSRTDAVAGVHMPDQAFARAQLRQTVARSTVPLTDVVKGSPVMKTSGQGEGGVPYGAAGVYHKDTDLSQGLISDPEIRVLPKYAHTFVPIHEIGHHTDRDQPYHTPQEKGRAEGFADAYADAHAKKPGYKRQPATTPQRNSESFGIWTEGMSHGMASAFEDKYKQQRPDPLQPAQFGHGTSDVPKNHVKGQIPLLDKVTSGWGTRQTKRWDYPLPEAPDGVSSYLNKTYGNR